MNRESVVVLMCLACGVSVGEICGAAPPSTQRVVVQTDDELGNGDSDLYAAVEPLFRFMEAESSTETAMCHGAFYDLASELDASPIDDGEEGEGNLIDGREYSYHVGYAPDVTGELDLLVTIDDGQLVHFMFGTINSESGDQTLNVHIVTDFVDWRLIEFMPGLVAAGIQAASGEQNWSVGAMMAGQVPGGTGGVVPVLSPSDTPNMFCFAFQHLTRPDCVRVVCVCRGVQNPCVDTKWLCGMQPAVP
ncbi:MAG: hypothetical protein HOP29_06005 [Phycisphaerales bacterium]|nr:hypothetical protein [Phycisphaerales bacterium]